MAKLDEAGFVVFGTEIFTQYNIISKINGFTLQVLSAFYAGFSSHIRVVHPKQKQLFTTFSPV